ncbi:MAG: histidine phosphatase family protein [Acidobacteria bacterium]|nr:histidine phosphatase family protein [Acidobacteriota bacterium]
MSTIYFFRHGQAGQRDDYDRLSELGREQARLLGEHVAGWGERFHLALTGGLRRQAETAEVALERLAASGLAPAETRVDPRWSEFDLDAVYNEIAPRMAAEDEEFRLEHEEVRRLVRAGDGHIHRRWTAADSKVVKAWIAGRYEIKAESWQEFAARVQEAGREFGELPEETKVAVFTSATPAAIWVAASFGSERPRHVMGLAGAAINANITVLRWRDGEPQLLSFNGVPHLGEARLRTFR